MILTIDSFAWAEMIRGSRLGRDARDAMEASEKCLTPSIVLAEVSSMCLRDGFGDATILGELRAIHESSQVVPLDDSIAMGAAHATQELKASARARHLRTPGLADGVILATARSAGAMLLTGDPHFRSCSETLWLGQPLSSEVSPRRSRNEFSRTA